RISSATFCPSIARSAGAPAETGRVELACTTPAAERHVVHISGGETIPRTPSTRQGRDPLKIRASGARFSPAPPRNPATLLGSLAAGLQPLRSHCPREAPQGCSGRSSPRRAQG